MEQKKSIDFFLLVVVLILLAFGTVMLFSSSTASALRTYGDTYYYIKKQMIFIPLGLIGMYFMTRVNYKQMGKVSPIILFATIFLLVLVVIPGIGYTANGSTRWLNLKVTTFQPSEILKIAIILFLSQSLAKNKDKLESFFQGLMPYLIIIGFLALLLLLEPHFSATMIVISVSTIILLSAGAKIKHFIILLIPFMIGVGVLIYNFPYRLARWNTFLDPWADIKGAGWQIVQSLYAIGTGGVFGKGLGKSIQKLYYIPEPHNDFILAIVAEELGYIGVFMLLLLFIIFIWRGIKIAINAPDLFSSLTAVGLTSLIAVQVIINVSVVTSSVPVTGMPLPFFSYGGTSLIFLLSGIGILLNISKYAKYNRI
jgi:cell division protein FtsW